jgi:large subunit ribosomal protein L4
MLEAPLFSSAGARATAAFALPEYFDGDVNEPVLHQAVTTYLNNQRQGTAAVKSRSFVSGGNQKPWKQKGTGRARQGTTRAPHWRGGGVAFGPIPRDYRTGIPTKVRQLARRSALNARAREGSLLVIEDLTFAAPKTGQLVALFEKLGAGDRKVLLLTGGIKRNVYLSARNLPAAQVMPYGDVTAYDVLWSDVVVVERSALGGGEVVAGTEAPAKPKRAVKAKAPKAAKSTAARAEAKPVAKRSAAKTPGKAAGTPAAKKKKETE